MRNGNPQNLGIDDRLQIARLPGPRCGSSRWKSGQRDSDSSE